MSRSEKGPVIQAGAIATRNGSVLIVRAKRNPSDWIFPKGHVEEGETRAEAARRELAEEAGVVGEIIGKVGVSSFTRGDREIEVTYFLVRFTGTTEPAEQRESRWGSLDEARALLSFDEGRRLLDRVEKRRMA